MLLKALSGRLHPSRRLRINGSVEYNGMPIERFSVGRAAALVEQREWWLLNAGYSCTQQLLHAAAAGGPA